MAIAVKLDDILHDRRMTLTEFADKIGMEGGLSNLTAVPIFVVWLYGTLGLAGRRPGYIMMILGSILPLGALYLHTKGNGLVGGRIANTSGVFFWTWTLMALGVTGLFSLILSVLGLWSLKWRRGVSSTT